MNAIITQYTARFHGPFSVSRLSLLIALALGSTAFATTCAQAQSATESDPTTLDKVSVTGVRASIQKSLVDKRNAAGIVDAIAAEDMGKFPDLNLSESLQRVSGITLERNVTGEGRAINLRGLGPEFTRVEINGMSGMSNGTSGRVGDGGGGRAFNFEIFASELFSKATVYKTSAADLDEGGMAGTVRLETPRPLDHEGTHLSVSALGNYSDKLDHTDPRAAVLFSHNHNDIFGISASIAWSKSEFVSNTIENGNWRAFSFANTGIRASDEIRAAWNPTSPAYFVFSEERDNTGATLTLQFRPSERMSFTVDGMYGAQDSRRMMLRDDMAIEGGINAPTNVSIDEHGNIIEGSFTGVQQRVGGYFIGTDETYQQLSASLEWTPNQDWAIRPFFGFANRKAIRPRAVYSFRLADSDGVYDPGIVTYRIRGDFNDFSSTGTNFDDRPEDFLFNAFFFSPSHERDREHQARIDFERFFSNSDHRLKFGLRYNERIKDRNAMGSQVLRLDAGRSPATVPNLSAVFDYANFHVSGAAPGTPSRLLMPDPAAVRAVFLPNGIPIDGTWLDNTTGAAFAGTYAIKETTWSGWFQAELVLGALQLTPGLRFVRTEQSPSGFDVINQGLPTQVITPVAYKTNYDVLLPSLSTRYDLSDTLVLRAAYARTLTRPNLPDLSPSERVGGVDESGGTGSRGNPALEPYYAHNLDIGAEWYFSAEGLLAANVFYKDISGFIDTRSFTEERTFPRQVDAVLVTAPIVFTEPVNGVSAKIKGIELSAQSRFSRLPGILGNLGGIVNYSYTDSSADFSAADGEDDVRSRGLPGLSKKSANAVLYYDDGRFDARLTWVWRDHYLAQFNDNFGLPRFTDAYGQWDVSVNYRISDRVSIQAQVLNLTREQVVDQSMARGRYLPYGIYDMDRRFLAGIRVVF